MKAYDSAVIENISLSLPSPLSVSPNYTECVCTAGMMFSKYTSRFWSFCWPDLFPVSLFRGCFHLLNGTHPMSDLCNDSLPGSVRITVTAVGQHEKENRCVCVKQQLWKLLQCSLFSEELWFSTFWLPLFTTKFKCSMTFPIIHEGLRIK